MNDQFVSVREELEAERDFLLSSITDLERELAAGDLDSSSYEELRADYVRRAASCLRQLEGLEDAVKPVTPKAWRRVRRALGRSKVRRVLGVGTVVSFLGLAGIFAAHLAGVRLPGQSETGTVTMTQAAMVASELAQASVDANQGDVADAVVLYGQVLRAVPDQPTALTYGGWLTRLSGQRQHSRTVVAAGDAQIETAASVDPGYPDAQALRAVTEFEDQHNVWAAMASFSRMLADRPTTALLDSVANVARSIYPSAGRPLPNAFGSH